jgi:hypothetical protein
VNYAKRLEMNSFFTWYKLAKHKICKVKFEKSVEDGL